MGSLGTDLDLEVSSTDDEENPLKPIANPRTAYEILSLGLKAGAPVSKPAASICHRMDPPNDFALLRTPASRLPPRPPPPPPPPPPPS